MKTTLVRSLLLTASLLPPAFATAQEEPPPLATGLEGTVTDQSGGAPVIGAVVQVPGVGSATTDEQGKYVLPLAPGTYQVLFQQEVYTAKQLGNVVVGAEGRTRLDLTMVFDEGTVQEMVIEETADRRTENTILKERKNAAVVSDAISAQEIARTPDSGAQDSVKRVTSATVTEGKYVMVRGLGGRYTSTLLNGVQLPSPEPDKQAVPLDLFPNSLLSNLTVSKTYGASLPGNFGGGSLQITTNAYPPAYELKTKIAMGGDTAGTFQSRETYRGGSLDFLGMDDGGRALPGSVPGTGPLVTGNPGMDPATVDAIGRDFDNRWSTSRSTALPNLTLGATVGNTLPAGTSNKLGYLATVNYGHKETVIGADLATVRNEAGAVTYRDKSRSQTGVEAANVGALVNGGFQIGTDHEIGLLTLYTHTGESRAHVVNGFSEADGQDFESTRLEFVNRTLGFSQLAGRHRLPALLEANWQANASITTRDEPDTRDTDYTVLATGEHRFKSEPGSGERFFSRLTDLGGGAGASLAIPTSFARFSTGAAAQHSTRQFDARRFRFDFIGSDPSVLFLPAEEMLAPERIGVDFRLEERTLQADAYEASLAVYSGFAEMDLTRLDPVRVIAGVRYELAQQRLTPGSRFAVTSTPEPGVHRDDADVLPALNVVWAMTPSTNVRAGYSYTLARPQFRELAPFLYTDFSKRRSISGNPNLVETRVHNADVRWEWFPGFNELFSATLFAKEFEKPIEQVIVSTTGDLSFDNAKGATAYGAELEARTSLARVSDALAAFRISGNLAVIESEIDLGRATTGGQDANRPLQGLSPLVLNLNASWAGAKGTEITLLYNVFGRRIVEVGLDTLPDVYEQPFHRVDLTVSHPLRTGLQLKAGATNLLDQPVTHRAAGLTTLRVRPGLAGTLSLEWTH